MKLINSHACFQYLKPRLSKDVEEFWCVALTSQLKVIRSACLFRGSVDQCPIHPREVFRFAYKANASRMIISHSHPSGETEPSEFDLIWTRRLLVASDTFNIPILDHLILGGDSFYSLADNGQMKMIELDRVTDHILAILDTPGVLRHDL